NYQPRIIPHKVPLTGSFSSRCSTELPFWYHYSAGRFRRRQAPEETRMETTVQVFTILGNLALIAGVLMVLRQLPYAFHQTRASNAQRMVEIASPFLLAAVSSREVAELALRSAESYESLDAVDQRRFRSLLIFWLIFYENVYYQRRHRFLDRHAFLPWLNDLKHFIRDHNVGRHWDGLHGLFQEEFASTVSKLVVEIQQESADELVKKYGG